MTAFVKGKNHFKIKMRTKINPFLDNMINIYREIKQDRYLPLIIFILTIMDFWIYCIVLILRCQNLEISSLGKPFKKLPSICFQQQIWQYMHKVICLTYLQMDLYIYHSHSVKICLPQRYNGEKRFLLSMSKLAKRWNASTISHNLNYDHNRSLTTSYKLQLWDKKYPLGLITSGTKLPHEIGQIFKKSILQNLWRRKFWKSLVSSVTRPQYPTHCKPRKY